MKTYQVTIPIAGHVIIEVEAENAEQAETKAWEEAGEGLPSWDTLEKFNSGNVCHCPLPWEVTVEEI